MTLPSANPWHASSLAAIAGCLLLCTAVGCPESPGDSQQRLRREALESASTSEQVEATTELAEHGREAAEPLRQVLQQSTKPVVRAAAAEGLGKALDVDSFPQLIDALESDSPEVRHAADAAIEEISGRDYFYDPDADPEQRAEAIARIREFWQEAQQPGSRFIEYRRHPEKLAEAKRKAAARYGGH